MRYVIIPNELMELCELSLNQKCVLAQLFALMNREGYCFATDQALAEMMGFDTRRTVQKYLQSLEKNGFIYREQIKKGSRTTERRIYATEKTKELFFEEDTNKITTDIEQTFDTYENKCTSGYEQMVSHNNKYNNINNNIIKSQTKEISEEELFSRIYTSVINRISKDGKLKSLDKYQQDIYKRVREKYILNKAVIKNKSAYIKAVIINTCREEFECDVPRYKASELDNYVYDHDAIEKRMWDAACSQ